MNDVLKNSEQKIEDHTIIRVDILVAIVFIALSVIVMRLWYLQALNGEKYGVFAEENRIRSLPVRAPRGKILDRERRPLAVNRLAFTMTLIPEKMDDEKLLSRISELLEIPLERIKNQVESKLVDPLMPRVIKRDVSPDIVAYVKEHADKFPGVEIIDDPIRDYPRGTLASHVLGYLSEISDEEMEKEDPVYLLGDLIGKNGVENEYEDVLRGSKGVQVLEVNANNESIRTLKREVPDPGNDLVLTIDADIQEVAERALQKGMDLTAKDGFKNAKAGAIVVMDPNNGEILAMTSLPTYDPRIFSGGISEADWMMLNDENNLYPLNNRAMMSSYPPGSTFKIVTSIAGLRTGVITSGSRFTCTGAWTGWGQRWMKPCWKRSGHGSRNLEGALIVSCDSYFYDVSYLIHKRGKEELQFWSRKMGLGAKTGIDLPGETKGRIPDKKWKAEFNKTWPENQTWFPGDTVNMAIGQGDLLLSPLQLASIYSIIANEGLIPNPHVVKEVITTDGKKAMVVEAKELKKLDVPANDFATIERGLRKATTVADGTAFGAFLGFPIPVAGKTGTSEVAGKDDYAFFAAYAPVNDPKYVISVVIEQGGHGGSAAGPAAREIFDYLFGIEDKAGKKR